MRVLWTLVKVIIGLAIAIPVGFLALTLTVGVVGTLLGLAVFALRLACIGLVGYGVYRLARLLFGSSSKAATAPIRELPQRDPYYEAAMRELDAEMRHSR
jgi:hypothetical protein